MAKVISICFCLILQFVCLGFNHRVSSLEIEEDAVFVRVVDTGAGLGTITRMPGDHYMVYDAGHWNGDEVFMDRVREIIPQGKTIELLVISHSDSDHLGAVKELLQEYNVVRVIRTGMVRDTTNWQDADAEIQNARQNEGTRDINLRIFDFPDGATYRYGDTFVTKVAGVHQPPLHWGQLSTSEKRNANSVVIRLFFNGKSILYTGDAVGRHSGQSDDVAIATEKHMIENAPVIDINSDVLIAPHHGADNGSSSDFIQAVSPTWVIFSAGNDHGHPRDTTANRYLNQGVQVNNILRTDRGDDEDNIHGHKEWKHESVSGHQDPIGDDDVDILIRPDGEVLVEYRNN